jgi:hypothetical protein
VALARYRDYPHRSRSRHPPGRVGSRRISQAGHRSGRRAQAERPGAYHHWLAGAAHRSCRVSAPKSQSRRTRSELMELGATADAGDIAVQQSIIKILA